MTGLLFILPAVAALLVLATGRYPAADVIAAVARRRSGRGLRRSGPPKSVPQRRSVLVLRGGALLACSLAGRAPPPATS